MLLYIFTNEIPWLTFQASWEVIPHTEHAKRAHTVSLYHSLCGCSTTLDSPPGTASITAGNPKQIQPGWGEGRSKDGAKNKDSISGWPQGSMC